MKALDVTDFKILNILQDDSTISVKDIAEQVGLSFSPTYERIKNLKNNGIIQKYVAILDAEKSGFEIMAYCNITLKEQSHEKLLEFETKIKEQANVLEVVSLSGTYDYMIKVVAKNIKQYNKFMTEIIANIPNIGQYHSNIVLSVIKDETKLTFEI
ncbi:MAG: Lrp/AsnC family transcriptional regulator [Cruoricaptor ignavus]|nr:Lrp/AsnC family transcriptional regulator [Cruoricaptor ignavus]